MNKPQIYDEYLKDQSIPLIDKNVEDIYGYEIYLLNTLKLNFNPNKIIEEAISKSSWYSYHYAVNLLDVFKDINVIPKIIEDAIAKDFDYSYFYAVNLLEIYKDIKVIPKIIEETIAKDAVRSNFYIKFLNKNNIIITDETFDLFKVYLIP